MRDIKIKAVLNGYIVKVGCQTVVFNDLDTLIDELRRYLEAKDPEKIEKLWLTNSLNSGKVGRAMPEPIISWHMVNLPEERAAGIEPANVSLEG